MNRKEEIKKIISEIIDDEISSNTENFLGQEYSSISGQEKAVERITDFIMKRFYSE
jgi:hypothetical protein